MTGWVPTSEVLAHLRVCRRTLAGLMADTPRAGLAEPWRDVGSGRHRVWRWEFAAVDGWFREVTAWRRSLSEVGSTSSVGTTPTGPSAPVPFPTLPPLGGSKRKSKSRGPLDDVGNLLTLTPSRR